MKLLSNARNVDIVGMNRWTIPFILSMLIAFPAWSQPEPIVDTLDWKAYFPLEIGNTWEYKFGNELYGQFPEGYDYKQIVGDSIVDGIRYYVHEATRYDANFQLRDQESDLLRYDETRRAVVELVSDDTSQHEQAWPEASLTCDLGASFYSKVECSSCIACDSVLVDGRFGEPEFQFDGLESDVVKIFYYPFTGYGRGFFHGTGVEFLEADFEQGYRRDLVFVRLDGEEYGRSEVATSLEQPNSMEASTAFISSVYPNPTVAAATVEYELPYPQYLSIEVYDGIGRRVKRLVLGWRAAGAHSNEVEMYDFASGIYFVRLRSYSGADIVTQLTVR